MGRTFHHGWRVNAAVQPNPLVFADTMRSALLPVYRDLYIAALAKHAAYLFDAHTLHLPGDRERSPLSQAGAALEAAQQKSRSTLERDPFWDFACEANFVTAENDPSGDWYVLLHTEHDAYRDALAALPGIEHWPWYSAEHPPQGISDGEWAHRERTWAQAIPDPYTRRGLTWELFSQYTQLRVRNVLDDVVAAVPTADRRAKEVASLHTRIADVVDGELRMFDLEDIVAARDAKAAELLPLLQPTLTLEDLQRPYAA